jgi:hypothetical protein
LCAGTECQCVSACHPCPVAGDVVHDYGQWRSGDARVTRQQVVTTSQFGKAQRAGYRGDNHEHPPAVCAKAEHAVRPKTRNAIDPDAVSDTH